MKREEIIRHAKQTIHGILIKAIDCTDLQDGINDSEEFEIRREMQKQLYRIERFLQVEKFWS